MIVMACGEEAVQVPAVASQAAATTTPTTIVHQDHSPSLPVLTIHFDIPAPAPAPVIEPEPAGVIAAGYLDASAPAIITAAEASGLPAAVERWRGLVGEYFPAAHVEHVLWTINCESRGDPLALGGSGAFQGLLQEMPIYHLAKAHALGFAVEDLFDPRVNIAVAAVISGGGENMAAWPVCG